MTNPNGRSFLSYRRTRSDDARLLIEAQHDVGIPTWQDIHDLEHTPLESALERALRDPDTANAIIWLTPEIASSDIVRRVELGLIHERHVRSDGFFARPVAAGGLGYEQAADIARPPGVLETFDLWNMDRTEADPLTASEAARIARSVLENRIARIHAALPGGQPLRLRLFTRVAPGFDAAAALSIDWTHRFEGRFAVDQQWQTNCLPALRTIADVVRCHAPSRPVIAEGYASLPAVTALGAAFLAPAGTRAGWRQQYPNGTAQILSLDSEREASGFDVSLRPLHASALDIAVLVSVNASVEAAATNTSTLPRFRVAVDVRRANGNTMLTPSQAADLAYATVEAIRAARHSYQATGRVHLFLAAPAGLAFLIGQLLNTFGDVQTYEHVADSGQYATAALLRPSI